MAQDALTLGCGVGHGAHDLLDLVDGGGAGEQRLSQQHLAQYAADTPHVHPLCVPVWTDRGR